MAHGAATASAAPPLDMGLRLRLSGMMFLQFAIWGSWAISFNSYLLHLGYPASEAGAIGALMAFGGIWTPMIFGFVADRFLASERLMAMLHIAGGVTLFALAQIQGPGQFWVLFVLTLAYAFLYNPTLALSNSICFAHVPDGGRDFPGIRVIGTIGWIVVCYVVDLLFGGKADQSNGPLMLAGGLSIALGVYSVLLPHTPPSGKRGDALPFLKALSLFKNFSFAVFFIVSFVITIVLAFYYNWTYEFVSNGLKIKNAQSLTTIGQWAELILLPFLPFFLRWMRMKWVLALGMLCWGIRYALFAFGGAEGLPLWFVIVGIALHGVCFDFFFAAGFIHVDQEAPKDIRASGQALFGMLTYGAGMWLGGIFAGNLLHAVTTHKSEPVDTNVDVGIAQVGLHAADAYASVVDWRTFWLVPSIGVLASLFVFVVFFHQRKSTPVPAQGTDDVKKAA